MSKTTTVHAKPGDTITIVADNDDEKLVESARQILREHKVRAELIAKYEELLDQSGKLLRECASRFRIPRLDTIQVEDLADRIEKLLGGKGGKEQPSPRCLSNWRGFEPEVVLLCSHPVGHAGEHKATFPNSTKTWSWDR